MFSSWSTLRIFFIFFWLKSVLKGLWIFVCKVLSFVGQFLIYGLVSNWHNLGQSVNKQPGQIGLTCYWILFYYFFVSYAFLVFYRKLMATAWKPAF